MWVNVTHEVFQWVQEAFLKDPIPYVEIVQELERSAITYGGEFTSSLAHLIETELRII